RRCRRNSKSKTGFPYKQAVKRKDKWQKARRGGIGRDPAGKSGLAWAKMQILADPGGPNLRRG
ncbi:MAG TPA: hypothetical protein PKX73_11165, partial [Anaerohalosphaeraceae bacterium]|nr:hypothetical protein [Anaerohalosphaeraceae bacterium]